jgi:hypothetical protein
VAFRRLRLRKVLARPGAGGGFGGGAMDMGGGGDTAPGVGGTPANPKAPAPRDFKVSLTGRATNPLYDVINVEVGLVVENHRLPQVLDEIAKYNFMTVTGLQLKAVNPFEALAQGFFYGPEPVTEVHLNIETIWLREWTREFMPKATRQALGIPLASPAGTS